MSIHLAKNWEREKKKERSQIYSIEPYASRHVTRAKSINVRTIIGAREALLLRGESVIGINTTSLAPCIEWSRSVNTIKFNPQLFRFSDRVHYKYFAFAYDRIKIIRIYFPHLDKLVARNSRKYNFFRIDRIYSRTHTCIYKNIYSLTVNFIVTIFKWDKY